MTTKLTEKNISSVSNFGMQWQSVITADGSTTTNLEVGKGYFIDTTSASHTVTLPTSPNVGDVISIKDYAGTFGTNRVLIQRNGHNIQGVANDSQVETNRANVELVYIDTTKGWLFVNESNVGNLENRLYIEASGGTATTSGDYKIHTFTGDGTFCVSSLGNDAGGGTDMDYLVIAGGGGGSSTGDGNYGAGGAGAGGYRESVPSPASWTASPKANPGGSLTASISAYPVTVGAGGSGGAYREYGQPGGRGTDGSNSSFSTITSAGGGTGGQHPGPAAGSAGGSGGGSSSRGPGTGASGNTPPVSPPQGNSGGGSGGDGGGAGGGAAGAGGGNNGGDGGTGGPGTPSSITGSSVFRAGGGGGGGRIYSSGGSGGPGGGGNGGKRGQNGGAGTANTGSGGGGVSDYGTGGTGGKGLVVIRYKYQN